MINLIVEKVNKEMRKVNLSGRNADSIYVGGEEADIIRAARKYHSFYSVMPLAERDRFMGLKIYLVNSDSHLRVV